MNDQEFESLVASISGQESGGNYEAENGRTGAYGKFQIMPENWDSWASEAGLEGATPDPESQETVARFKLRQYYDKYGAKGAAMAWYAGEGAFDYDAEALNRKQGNGDEPSINEYANSVLSRMGKDPVDIFFSGIDVNEHGVSNALIRQVKQYEANNSPASSEDAGFVERVENQLNENFLVGLGRAKRTEDKLTSSQNYIFSQDDEDYVKKALPGNTAAQNWVYTFAKSREQLEKLVQLKVEDTLLRKKVDASPFLSINTLGSVLGFVAGEVLNPVNYVPMGIISKGSLAVKMLKGAGANALLNTLDSDMRERMTGYEQNFTTSALTGAVVGAVLPALGHLVKSAATPELSKVAREVEDTMVMAGENSKAILMGADSADRLPRSKFNTLKKIAIDKYETDIPELKAMMDNGTAVVVSRDQSKKLKRIFGDVPENVKGFNAHGVNVFFKEALDASDSKSIRGLFLHEVGVHAMPTDMKKPLIDYTTKQMANPTGTWKTALNKASANTPDGQKVDPEEVLGYFAEEVKAKGKGGHFSAIKDIVRKMAKDDSLDDDAILDIIEKNAKSLSESKQPFKVLPDGSAIINGDIKMSANNVTNPNNLEQLANLESDGQKEYAPWMRPITKYFERGFLHRTPAGVFMNTVSPTLKRVGMSMVEDARNRASAMMGKSLPAETVKKMCRTQLDTILRPLQEDFNAYMWKSYQLGWKNPKNVNDTWEKVIKYHDSVYGGHAPIEVDEEIKSLANQVHALEQKEIVLAKQYGFLDDEWKHLDESTRRVTNDEKLRNWLYRYEDIEGKEKGLVRANKELHAWAKEAMLVKTEDNRRVLQGIYDKEYEDAVLRYNAEKKHFEEVELPKKYAKIEADKQAWIASGKDVNKFRRKDPQFTKLPPIHKEATDENLLKWIDEEAKGWAYGQMDRNMSSFYHADDDGTQVLKWMKHRVHMDTSYQKELNGAMFSYDDNLRSYDFGYILNKTADRWSGEIALRQVFAEGDTFNFKNLIEGTKTRDMKVSEVRRAIENELKQANRPLGDIKRELETFDTVIDELRGNPKDEIKTTADVAASLLRKVTYAARGSYMGFNQLMEVGGAMGYVGNRMVMSLMPWVRKPFMVSQAGGKKALDSAEAALVKLFGEDTMDLNWARANLIDSRAGRAADPLGFLGSTLDTLNNIANVGSAMTSSLNMLPKLTKQMLHDVKLYTYLDVLKYARGEEFSKTRNPFSAKKLKAIGVTDAEVFRANLTRYLTKDGKGLNLIKMKDDNVDLFNDVYRLIDTQAKRAITQDTLGNKNLLADSNLFWRLFYQFKNFNNLATNSQFFNKMHDTEIDDVLSTLYSMSTGIAVTTGLYYLKGYSLHGDDPGKRKEYLDKNLSGANIARMAFLRSGVIGSPASIYNDAVEGWFNLSSNRTTVADTSRFAKGKGAGEVRDRAGRIMTQMPMLDTADNILKGVTAPYQLAKGDFTQQDLKDALSILPMSNFAPFQKLTNEMVRRTQLPTKSKN